MWICYILLVRIVNTNVDDGLVPQGARASAAIVLTCEQRASNVNFFYVLSVYLVSTMAADGLVMQGARVSAARVLI